MRFVDDVFAVLKNETNVEKVLEVLNTPHPNIKFTIEHEKKNKLPFLDTCVTRTEETFKTTMYRKPTFTGVYLNWTSLTSRNVKNKASF
jgi:reverse gyrase